MLPLEFERPVPHAQQVGNPRFDFILVQRPDQDVIDDPLVFIAQPDSLILTRDFANRNHIQTGSKITLQKGTEKWEIDLDPTIKATGDVKVGATVTITYVMSATKVEGSAAAAAAETTPAVPSPASSP